MPDLESESRPEVNGTTDLVEASDESPPASEVDDLLGQLQDGLQKAEATMASILEGIVADNASVLAELEAALTDMEAALAKE